MPREPVITRAAAKPGAVAKRSAVTKPRTGTKPRASVKRGAAAPARRSRRTRRAPFSQLVSWFPKPQMRRLWATRWRRVPLALRALAAVAVLLIGWVLVNTVYHVARKPTELFFLVSDALYKTPAETWAAYGSIFRAHSTAVMTPELLAALAQIEGSGNPVARTYWRWSLTPDPLEIYRPASSAVGMFQFTDGTFDEARHYCIRNHRVVEDGPWNDFDSCWFNSLYFRVLPSHSVELTAAYLDNRITATLARHHITRASLTQKQQLATLIHLCGAGAGNEFARRGFSLRSGQRCGDHEARGYLDKVARMKAVFVRLARG